MYPAIRSARRRLLLRRYARAVGRYLGEGLIWLGLAMGPLASPSALPTPRRPPEPPVPPVPPAWHPEYSVAGVAPRTAVEAALWEQLEG